MEIVPADKVFDKIADIIKDAPLFKPVVRHHFSDGVCVREMEAPAGSLIVGAKHKTDHLSILLHGTMVIRIGDTVKTLVGPTTFEALAGSRKIGFAITDCTVSNIFPTDSKDIQEIEDLFTDLNETDFTQIGGV